MPATKGSRAQAARYRRGPVVAQCDEKCGEWKYAWYSDAAHSFCNGLHQPLQTVDFAKSHDPLGAVRVLGFGDGKSGSDYGNR